MFLRTPRRFRSAIVLLTALGAGAVHAGPWLDAGDGGLRHDVQLLADGGAISAPVGTWPLSWADALAIDDARLDDDAALAAAAARLRRRAQAAGVTDVAPAWQPRYTARVGSEGRTVRDFHDLGREKLELGAGIEWTGARSAVRLMATVVTDPDDDRELRADGSHAALALGNWSIGIAISDRWWGPGWAGSTILSNNARPVPTVFIDRVAAQPFESRWLRWIGAWDAVAFMGQLESARTVPDALLFGMRLSARPARFLEVGVSRLAMWCGDGRPCGLDTFGDLLLGRDNAGDNVAPEDEPGNQLAGYDIRLSAGQWGIPVALYTQRTGEDEQDLKPALFLTQVGMETWGTVERFGSWRAYIEVVDTLCGGNITGSGTPDCAYDHPIYQTGIRHRGRPLAHSLDNDAEVWTFGVMLNDIRDGTWQLRLSAGDLNREGTAPNSVADGDTRYKSVQLDYRRPLPVGRLDAAAGVERYTPRTGGGSDDDWRLSLGWSYGL